MSVTKTTTTVAILQLLDELNLSVDSKIEKWLPASGRRPRRLGLQGPLVPPSAHAHVRGSGRPSYKLKAMNPESARYWGNGWDRLEFVVSNGAAPGSRYSYRTPTTRCCES